MTTQNRWQLLIKKMGFFLFTYPYLVIYTNFCKLQHVFLKMQSMYKKLNIPMSINTCVWNKYFAQIILNYNTMWIKEGTHIQMHALISYCLRMRRDFILLMGHLSIFHKNTYNHNFISTPLSPVCNFKIFKYLAKIML